VLSGGEKSRLALAKMLAHPANLLCMDEPTNHLDINSRDVLEDALVEYPGTVVLITHDRHLIRSAADTIIEVRDGWATVYPGDFEYYAAKTGIDLDRRGATEGSAPAGDGAGLDGEAPAAEGRSRPDKRAEAERRNRMYRETKELRRRLEQVEEDLGEAEAEVADLTRTLADPEVYEDSELVQELLIRHNVAKDRAAELTDRWERLYTQVEEATARAGG
jgi:ATP-binding cassette, subfamily F, member 3